MTKLPCEDLSITDEETRSLLDLRSRLYKLANDLCESEGLQGKSDDGSVLAYFPGWFGGDCQITVAHYPWGEGRRTTYSGATIGDCLRKANLDVDKWEHDQAAELGLGIPEFPAATLRRLSFKARLYRRAGGKKIVVAEGVLREEEPSQFLVSDGKLYRWDQDYEGEFAVYFWYRDLPAFEVTSRG